MQVELTYLENWTYTEREQKIRGMEKGNREVKYRKIFEYLIKKEKKEMNKNHVHIAKYQKVKQNHNTLVLYFTTESQIKYAEHSI